VYTDNQGSVMAETTRDEAATLWQAPVFWQAAVPGEPEPAIHTAMSTHGRVRDNAVSETCGPAAHSRLIRAARWPDIRRPRRARATTCRSNAAASGAVHTRRPCRGRKAANAPGWWVQQYTL